MPVISFLIFWCIFFFVFSLLQNNTWHLKQSFLIYNESESKLITSILGFFYIISYFIISIYTVLMFLNFKIVYYLPFRLVLPAKNTFLLYTFLFFYAFYFIESIFTIDTLCPLWNAFVLLVWPAPVLSL